MKLKVGLIAFIIAGLSYSFYLVFIKDYPPTISEKEAEAIVTNLYGGEVLDTKVDPSNSTYQLKLDHEKGIYRVSVHRKTKKISNIQLIEKKEALLSMEEAQKNIEKELSGKVTQINQIDKEGNPLIEATVEKNNKHYRIEYDLLQNIIVSNTEVKSSVKPPLSISEEQAKEIALEQIKGQITNLSIVTNQNGKHYKVTVDDQAEGAHVYVQANTGNVSSISWYEEQPDPDIQQPQSDIQQSASEIQQPKQVKQQPKPIIQQSTEPKNDESNDSDDDDDVDEESDDEDDDEDD
ncbi:PepSY domain-containing protein [Niallia sp. XMNu-256]|uniref:PepSY domain-containing protein n=1 Tax=Niallia sp. XMNu-256 TaxID=3082444 RepID=UPI0030D46434